MKVYSPQNNFRTQKVLIAAKVANKNVEIVDKQPPNNRFPLGHTPALEDGEVSIFGSDAIAKYLVGNNSEYNPQNPEIDQWLSWAEAHLLPNVLAYVIPSVSIVKVEAGALKHAKNELLAQLRLFNAILLKRTYLVGERLTIADVSIALDLLPAYQHVLDQQARSDLINLNRWFRTVVNQQHVKDVVGEVEFANKVSTFDQGTHEKHLSSQAKNRCKIVEKRVRKKKKETPKIL